MSVPSVIVAGMGPADGGLIPPVVRARLATGRWWLRTVRHPAAAEVNAVGTFDSFYDDGDTFEDTYARIADALIVEATEHGEVGYVVPGSPLVLERTVELLSAAAARGEIRLEVLPAMSFLDLAWAALGVDPVTAGVRLVDGHRFAVDAAGERGPLLVAHTHSRAVLSDIKLAVLDDPSADADGQLMMLWHLGLPDQRLIASTWAELDRGEAPDHLTSLWVPQLAAPVASSVQRLSEVIAGGSRGQVGDDEASQLAADLASATRGAVDALATFDAESGDGTEALCDGLGSVLEGVARAGRLGERAGWFGLADVAEAAGRRAADSTAD